MSDEQVWILAHSMEDPDEAWVGEEEALSCPDAGNARCFALPPEEWSGYLIWIFEPSIAAGIEISFYIPTSNWEYEIDYHDGREWHSLRAGAYQGDTWPLLMDFPAMKIARVRLRVRHFADKARNADAFCCRLKAGCYGPLCAICDFLGEAGGFLAGLADDIAGWVIVGDALSAPLRALSELFITASQNCCEASGALQDILDVLSAGISIENFAALLREYFPLLYYLVVDPRDQVLYLIAQAFDLTPYEAQSAEFIVKTLFERYFPGLYHLWLDPAAWLLAELEEHFTPLYYLIVDPSGELLYLIAQLFDLEPYQARSAEMVVKTLFERYFPDLYHFWRVGLEMTWDWLLDKFEETFEDISARLYSIAEHAVRFFWEGEW